jgi:hypothetical protein
MASARLPEPSLVGSSTALNVLAGCGIRDENAERIPGAVLRRDDGLVGSAID